MPWTDDGEYVYDESSGSDNSGNYDYTETPPEVVYQPAVLPDVAYEGDTNEENNISKNPNVSPADASRIPKEFGEGITSSLNKLFGTNMSGKQLASLFGTIGGGIAGATGLLNPKANKVGFQGSIPKYTAVRNMMTAPPAGRRPGAGGVNYGGDVSYMPKGSAPSQGLLGGIANLTKEKSGLGGSPVYGDEMPYLQAIKGVKTAEAMDPSQFAQAYAQGGLTNLASGRYLQGSTDGMADKIKAQIGEDQPAALSHGEFVVPADVVSHLGNGNSDAGAKKLYQMMDKIRQARTGTKKQGKKINPDKFMPGGLANAYANGGHVQHFVTGGTPAAPAMTGQEQTVASWTGDYVPNMLGKAQALAEEPYQAYQGPLTAGASNLQNQAFNAAGNLSVPGSVGTAAQTAGDIAAKAQNVSYTPTQFDNQFKAPEAYKPSNAPQYDKLSAQTVSSTFQAPEAYKTGTFDNQFKAPEISAATQFENQFKAPDAYKATDFKGGTFDQQQAQQYMNPYLQSSLNPQLEEARRQSNITEQQNKAAMTKAGAFGGGRSAILAAENQRNLGTNLADITGKGYNTAFQNAMSQFNADQGRSLQAQQAAEQSKQFGAQQSMTAADMQAKYGMSAQQAQEAARQFNQGQSMTAADMQAKYGMSAQQAQEASRQFGANQALQAATTAGSQGLQAATANQQAGLTAGQGNINAAMEAARQQEQSRQFGANQGLTAAQSAAQYGQAAQQAAEQSKQFGADLGIKGLQTGLQAAQTQGNLGISSGQLNLAQLQEQANLGAQQRGIEAEGIAADKAAFEEARNDPYKKLQFQQAMLNGLPISATNYQYQEPDWLTNAAGGATTVNKLLDTLGLGTSTGSAPPKK